MIRDPTSTTAFSAWAHRCCGLCLLRKTLGADSARNTHFCCPGVKEEDAGRRGSTAQPSTGIFDAAALVELEAQGPEARASFLPSCSSHAGVPSNYSIKKLRLAPVPAHHQFVIILSFKIHIVHFHPSFLPQLA